jgi:hypothetical protein
MLSSKEILQVWHLSEFWECRRTMFLYHTNRTRQQRRTCALSQRIFLELRSQLFSILSVLAFGMKAETRRRPEKGRRRGGNSVRRLKRCTNIKNSGLGKGYPNAMKPMEILCNSLRRHSHLLRFNFPKFLLPIMMTSSPTIPCSRGLNYALGICFYSLLARSLSYGQRHALILPPFHFLLVPSFVVRPLCQLRRRRPFSPAFVPILLSSFWWFPSSVLIFS